MKRFALLCLALLASTGIGSAAAQTGDTDVNLLFIGNSITYGAGLGDRRDSLAPPAVVKRLLEREEGIAAVRMINAGISGLTTVSYLPGSGRHFERVVREADKLAAKPGVMVISMMLGTNDSAEKGPKGAPVPAGAYVRNLQTIVDTLLRRYPKASILLHRPIWYSDNTQNSAVYLKGGQRRLRSYSKPLELLVENYQRAGILRVALGDTRGYELFEADAERLYQHEEGACGTFFLHPNADGAELLGRLWCAEILKAVRRRAPEPAPARHQAQFERYEAANRSLTRTPDVVFMGNSITDNWIRKSPEFFENNNFVDRGISGQTTCEMLARFRADVIDLKPKAVVIMAGINDIARNSGYIPLKQVFGNIVSMCELAKLHGIKVVLCSVTPCSRFSWRPEIRPAENIRLLNTLLQRYAQERLIPWVDYYSALVDNEGGMQACYTDDGCHPTREGYAVMEPLAVEGIRQVLGKHRNYYVKP